MESLLSAFSGLPYFSPFSCFNKSGTCGASRILQTRWMGCSTGAPACSSNRWAREAAHT